MRWGSILVAVGAVLWLVQGALLLSTLPAVSGAFNLGSTGSSGNGTGSVAPPAHSHVWIAESAIAGSIGTFVLATVVASLAAALLAAGALLLTYSPEASGDRATHRVSRNTKILGGAAAAFAIGFVILGGLAVVTLSAPAASAVGASCGSWGDGCPITTAFGLWVAGAAFLLIGAELYSVFLERISRETAEHIQLHGSLFSNYAIVNFVGLAVVPFAVVTAASNPSLSDSLLYATLYAQLFVVPLTGFVAWGWLTVQAIHSAVRSPPEFAGQAPGAPGAEGRLRETEALASPSLPSDSARLRGVAGAHGSEAAGHGLGTSPLGPDWAFRLQTRIQNLERLVSAQNETISHLQHLVMRETRENVGSGPAIANRIGIVESFGPESPSTVRLSDPRVPPDVSGFPPSSVDGAGGGRSTAPRPSAGRDDSRV